jgi:hypothetical protein
VIGHGMMGDEYEGRVMGERSMGLMLWMMVNEGDGGWWAEAKLHGDWAWDDGR